MINELKRPYPIVEYAREIGKNTADMTVNDMVKFTKKWMKQPQRKDLLKVTPEQRKGYEKDLKKAQEYFQKHPEKAKAVRDYIAECESKHNGGNKMKIKANKSIEKAVEEVLEEEQEEQFVDEDGNPVDAEGNPIGEVEQEEDPEDGEEGTVQEEQVEEETVANIELTRKDVDALLWGINQLFEDYDLSEHEMGGTLTSLKEVLESIQ